MEQFLENIKEWLFTFSLPTGNASFWEMISAIGSILVPFVILWWAKQDSKKRERKEEAEGLREYIHSYISPFIDEKDLNTDFQSNISKITYNLNILNLMVKDSEYHKERSKQLNLLSETLRLIDLKKHPEMASKTKILIQILPRLFYLSDKKFKLTFTDIITNSQFINTFEELVKSEEEKLNQRWEESDRRRREQDEQQKELDERKKEIIIEKEKMTIQVKELIRENRLLKQQNKELVSKIEKAEQ